MALVNITPVMTSNTTPSPYVVSASSTYAADYEAWKAFNGTTLDANDSWVTLNTIVGWVKIDFSIKTKIDGFSIVARNDTPSITANPKDFILYGSDDNISYTQIESISDQILWSNSENRLFLLKNSVNFRYYRINILSNNGYATFTNIGDIKFWQDDAIIEYVTNKKASLNYCLPKNSTLAMKQKQNDGREGLLGFANDGDNYGTLYMVDNKGQAIIPKASMLNGEVLFDGSASSVGAYNLNKDFNNYKYLLVLESITHTTAGNQCYVYSKLISVQDIVLNKTSQFFENFYSSAYITYYFNSTTSFYIQVVSASSASAISAVQIHKILGIY